MKVKVNLGCGRTLLPGYINLDAMPLPGIDILHNLESTTPLPLDWEVEEYRMSHVLEHLKDPLWVMRKCWDAAVPGCVMHVHVPYGSSDDAWEDPTHVRPYFLKSWGYFGQPNYWRAYYGYRADWKVNEVTLILDARQFPYLLDFHGDSEATMSEVMQSRNVVAEMRATLEAVKPARPPLRELQEPVKLNITYNNDPQT